MSTSTAQVFLVSNLARGQALDVLVKAPELETKLYDAVPVLDVFASYDAEIIR